MIWEVHSIVHLDEKIIKPSFVGDGTRISTLYKIFKKPRILHFSLLLKKMKKKYVITWEEYLHFTVSVKEDELYRKYCLSFPTTLLDRHTTSKNFYSEITPSSDVFEFEKKISKFMNCHMQGQYVSVFYDRIAPKGFDYIEVWGIINEYLGSNKIVLFSLFYFDEKLIK